MRIRDLTYKGYANQIPGRHVFRIDERVISGNCFDDESAFLNYNLLLNWFVFILIHFFFQLFTRHSLLCLPLKVATWWAAWWSTWQDRVSAPIDESSVVLIRKMSLESTSIRIEPFVLCPASMPPAMSIWPFPSTEATSTGKDVSMSVRNSNSIFLISSMSSFKRKNYILYISFDRISSNGPGDGLVSNGKLPGIESVWASTALGQDQLDGRRKRQGPHLRLGLPRRHGYPQTGVHRHAARRRGQQRRHQTLPFRLFESRQRP